MALILPKKNEMKTIQFSYQVPIMEKATVDKELIIKGTALTVTTTSNNHKFLPEELRLAADTLPGVPLLVDHKNEIDAIKGRVISGEFNEQENKITFTAKVIDKKIKEMILDGRINSVSIGADVTDLEDGEDGTMIPRGIFFRELSLVAVPADQQATFGVALKEAYDISKDDTEVIESQLLNKQEVKKMSKDTLKEQNTESEEVETEVVNTEVETKTEEVEKSNEVPKEEETKNEVVAEEGSKILSILEKMDARLAKLEESDKDEVETKEETKPEAKVEKTEEDEEVEDEEETEVVAEEKGNYSIVQSHGALKGGSFTCIRV